MKEIRGTENDKETSGFDMTCLPLISHFFLTMYFS